MEKKVVLELRDITKKYPGVTALDNVSFFVYESSILSLVGENGAGKSTLLKCISGVIPHTKYGGNIYYNEKIIKFNNTRDSESMNIAIVHQELAVIHSLSIAENIFMGYYESKFGVVNWDQMNKKAAYYLKMVGLDKQVTDKVGTLSVAEQQLVEIAKALSKNTKLLILDEPTSSLNDKDAFALLDTIKRLRDEEGISFIFVSHKLKEVEYVADYITIIRDGKHIKDYDSTSHKIDENLLIKDMVGRELLSKYPDKINKVTTEEAMRVENWSVENPKAAGQMVVKDASFDVKFGEIVGISGLVGSGRSELAMSIFGHSFGRKKSGSLYIRNKPEDFKSPLQAIKAKLMYASEDRKTEGLIQFFSILENISLASRHITSKFKFIINQNIETKNARFKKSLLNIKVPSINYHVSTLSGGNQQKVLLAKALSTECDILIVDEPTKGIDVGSKKEIYQILFDMASNGKAIIIISSELEELLGTTDRIFVMSQGEIKGQIITKNATQEKIMKMAISKKEVNYELK